MKRRSLARQAIASILIAELLCALTFMTAALLHERRARLRAFDVMLQGRSDSLFGAVQDADDSGDNVAIDPSQLHFPAKDAYAVYLASGQLLGSSHAAPPALIELGQDGLTNRTVNGHTYRVLQRREVRILDQNENNGAGIRRPVTLIYASPDERIWHGIIEAAGFYVLIGVLLISGTAVLMIVLMRRVLRPIRELGLAAGAVTARSLHFTPPESTMQMEELHPLATTLSAMVDRLNQSFQQQHRFVGDATHELKTAVAVTRSSIQLLLLRPRSVREYTSGLHELLRDNDRIEDLVARMLTLARLEERAMSGSASFNLATVARTIASRLKSLAEARNVAVEIRSSAALVTLSEEEAEVLISNLLANAIQHSRGGQAVTVEITSMAQCALLLVRDQGEGISPEALPHVFERFYREDSSRSRETGGAGLGLAICKSIVDTAGGKIEIDSAPGSGTTVSVTLPLVASPSA